MYKYFLLISLICSCSGNRSLQNNEQGKSKLLPLVIQYLKPEPSESVQNFMNINFRQKGFELITMKEGFSLMQGDLTGAIQGGVNDNSLRKAGETTSFQVLRVRIYTGEQNSTDFKIDSIYWKTFKIPWGDTGRYFKKFYPLKSTDTSEQKIFKNFADIFYVSQ